MNAVRLFLSFEGRIGRLQFWIGLIVVTLAEWAADWMFGGPLIDDPADERLRIIGAVIELIGMYPIAAIAVKRLHDRDQAGTYVWWLLAAFALALVGDV